VVEQVRALAQSLPDAQIATQLNQQGQRSATGRPFSASMICWIRFRHHLPAAGQRPDELTVAELADRLGVSHNVIYYWIERGLLQTRRLNRGAPCWITVDEAKTQELNTWIAHSTRIQRQRSTQDS
jgi:hypothetical protein